MKTRHHIQHHPNQENKTGKPVFASTTGLNSSTNGKRPTEADMPEGSETEYKEALKKRRKKK